MNTAGVSDTKKRGNLTFQLFLSFISLEMAWVFVMKTFQKPENLRPEVFVLHSILHCSFPYRVFLLVSYLCRFWLGIINMMEIVKL